MPSHITYRIGGAKVFLFGHQPRIGDDRSISYNQALSLGAKRGKIAQLIVASDGTKPGHKMVCPPQYSDFNFLDGVMVQGSGASVILQTADCPTVILRDPISNKFAVFHAGRPALTPESHCASCTVGQNAVDLLSKTNGNVSDFEALVVGNICGSCFKHDRPDAANLISPFLKYPDWVFADKEARALDLFQVIRHELSHRGVKPENIRHEGSCTFETPALSSYRRDKSSLRNTVIVVLD